MPINSPDPLPKTLPGVVLPQLVCCGRPNCRCSRGYLHGPYYYRFWREGGKLRKAYVKRADVERVKGLCEARQSEIRELRSGWDDWRRLLEEVRSLEAR